MVAGDSLEYNHNKMSINSTPHLSKYGGSLEELCLCTFTIKGEINCPKLNGRSEGHTFLPTAIVYTSGNED